MLKYVGIIALLSTSWVSAAEVGAPAGDAAVTHPARICQAFKHSLNPVKALHQAHDKFVNFAIHMSSIGIEQPDDTFTDPVLNDPIPGSQSLAPAEKTPQRTAKACVNPDRLPSEPAL